MIGSSAPISPIAIVGAGISGAYCAYLLANKGHQVVLFDAESLPYRATSCNPGGINPLHGPGVEGVMADFYLSCHRDHLLHKKRIQALSGIDYKLRVIDRLFLAFTHQEKQALLEMQEAYNRQQGFQAQWLTPEQVQLQDARISGDTVGGLLTHGNLVVDSRLYCQALLQAALKLGARHVPNNADDLICNDGRVTHIVCAATQVPCSAAVLAAGYWTQGLSDKLGVSLPLAPMQGELLLIDVHEAPFALDITRGLTGLYQAENSAYWLGGTFDTPSSPPGVTGQARAKILANIKGILPGLEHYTVRRQETGYRPLSGDKLPVTGRLPGYENIYLATGGGSKGILLSSGIGRVITELIEGSQPEDCNFLGPHRFNAVE